MLHCTKSNLIEELSRDAVVFQILIKIVWHFSTIMADFETPAEWVANGRFYVTRENFVISAILKFIETKEEISDLRRI